MLPRIRQNNRNAENIDPEVRDELEARGRFSDISNQSAEEYGDLLNPSNEANQPMRENYPDSESEDEKDDGSESRDIESEDEAAELAREAAEALAKRQGKDLPADDASSPESDVLNNGFYGKLPGLTDDKNKKPAGKAAAKSPKKAQKKASKKSGAKKAAEPLKKRKTSRRSTNRWSLLKSWGSPCRSFPRGKEWAGGRVLSVPWRIIPESFSGRSSARSAPC